MRRSKGSLTIEACISFSIFILFLYSLMIFVKFAMIDLTLDAATRETAKIIATSSYPVSFLNELEDERAEAAAGAFNPETYLGIINNAENDAKDTVIDMIFTSSSGDDLSFSNITDVFKKNFSSISEQAISDARAVVANKLDQALIPFLNNIKSKIATDIFDKCLENSIVKIDKSKLTFNVIEFPQSNERYKKTKDAYVKFGLQGENVDFGQNDAIVSVEYDYPFSLPLLPTYNVKLRYTAVEKGWINGSNGVITSWDEKLDLNLDIVYVTKTGKKYHIKDCRYLRLSRIAITREEAKIEGYGECSVCTKKD